MNDNVFNELLNNCRLGKLLEKPVRVTGGLLNRMYRWRRKVVGGKRSNTYN